MMGAASALLAKDERRIEAPTAVVKRAKLGRLMVGFGMKFVCDWEYVLLFLLIRQVVWLSEC